MQGEWLAHHGIEGQKWGVRNGPPYPLDPKMYKKAQYAQKQRNKLANKGVRPEEFRQRHVVPKGTTIYRTTVNPNEDQNGPMYISYIDADRQNYRGGWVRQTAGADRAYENQYTLQEDLVVPSRQELSKVVYDIVKGNPRLLKDVVAKHLELMLPEGSMEAYERTQSIVERYEIESGRHFNENEVDRAYERAYKEYAKDFVKEELKRMGNAPISELYFTAAQTFGVNPELKGAVIQELSKRGYNAVTDEASVGGQNGYRQEGYDPLIIFDGNMLQKNSTSAISDKEEADASRLYNQWANNAYRNARDSGRAWSDESGIAL